MKMKEEEEEEEEEKETEKVKKAKQEGAVSVGRGRCRSIRLRPRQRQLWRPKLENNKWFAQVYWRLHQQTCTGAASASPTHQFGTPQVSQSSPFFFSIHSLLFPFLLRIRFRV